MEQLRSKIQYFQYGEKEINWLKSKDANLGVAIDQIGHINRPVIPDIFMALVNSIVGQQISTKAQATIWNRMLEQFFPLTPEKIASVPLDELQATGISMRKAIYIQEMAHSILKGDLYLNSLSELSDEEICATLCQIKGIGVWTAEMVMIFSMERTDILSWDDLAIHRGLRMLYRHRKITRELFAKYKRRYSPYATVASLYLWAIAGGACPNLTDPAPKTEAQKKADAKRRYQQIKGREKAKE